MVEAVGGGEAGSGVGGGNWKLEIGDKPNFQFPVSNYYLLPIILPMLMIPVLILFFMLHIHRRNLAELVRQ